MYTYVGGASLVRMMFRIAFMPVSPLLSISALRIISTSASGNQHSAISNWRIRYIQDKLTENPPLNIVVLKELYACSRNYNNSNNNHNFEYPCRCVLIKFVPSLWRRCEICSFGRKWPLLSWFLQSRGWFAQQPQWAPDDGGAQTVAEPRYMWISVRNDSVKASSKNFRNAYQAKVSEADVNFFEELFTLVGALRAWVNRCIETIMWVWLALNGVFGS